MLSKLGKVLNKPKEAIENFDEQHAFTYFNTFNNSSFSHSNAALFAYNCIFNPLEKIIDLMDDNKILYECLLKIEREKANCCKSCMRNIR